MGVVANSAQTSRGYMELRFALEPPKPTINARELLDAVRAAEIHTFGWPIGIVMEQDEWRPRPVADGIQAMLSVEGQSYDFWRLRTNGDYYLLSSLFEDTHPNIGTG